jgi:hypothetical protein
MPRVSAKELKVQIRKPGPNKPSGHQH